MKNSKGKMIYTPQRHIPLGEAIKMKDGAYAIRVKRPRENEYDTIPVTDILAEVVKATETGV